MRKIFVFIALFAFPVSVSADITGIVTYPEGINGEVQISSGGIFFGESAFRYEESSNTLHVEKVRWADGTVQISSPGLSGGVGGVSVYPATATASFPLGFYASTATFTNVGDVTHIGVSTVTFSTGVYVNHAGSMTLSGGRLVAQLAPSDLQVLAWSAINSRWEPMSNSFPTNSTSYIQVRDTLQTGSTFYVSSGTVNSLTLGNAATIGTQASMFSQVKIIQVVSTTSVTALTTTSSSYQTTNLIGSIIPRSTSSTIIVFASGSLRTAAAGTGAAIASLFRGTTNLNSAVTNYGFGSLQGPASTLNAPWSAVYLDSPATTSSVTYSVKVANDDGATSVNFGNTGVLQSMILMEVNGL